MIIRNATYQIGEKISRCLARCKELSRTIVEPTTEL
uniref:Uncharacterized protein n=1 Tax=Siphoviridae sp. ctFn287 TaxID=2826215 RepID=A0A8S5LV47_9CAUD|nr:MAG TPA: hypothetical protein [Siphoviridae sp. ctFn287]